MRQNYDDQIETLQKRILILEEINKKVILLFK